MPFLKRLVKGIRLNILKKSCVIIDYIIDRSEKDGSMSIYCDPLRA